MTDKYGRVDVWWCGACDITWMAPSVPHDPWCPRCGVSGWWKRFATEDEKKNGMVYPPRPGSGSGR